MSENKGSDILANAILDNSMPDIAGIPLPPKVKKSLWGALGRLITGTVEVPIAYLESQAGKIRAHGKGTESVTLAAASAAAERFGSDPQLAERAVHHFGEKIVREQKNREAVAKATLEAIATKPPTKESEEEIDEDWLTEFTEIAAKKSNSEIRSILGRILAGEISKPGSFSPATLHTLTTLSQITARSFQILSEMSIADARGFTFVITAPFEEFERKGFSELGLDYSTFLSLQSAGLLTPAFTSRMDLNGYTHHGLYAEYADNQFVLRTSASQKIANTQITLFSSIGHELRSVIPRQINDAYDVKLRAWLAKNSTSIENFQNKT